MTTPEFKYGTVFGPLPESTEKSLLEDADPALNAMLKFLEWGIEQHIGPRLLAQARLEPNLKQLPKAVVQTVSADPLPFLFANQFQFPLLALTRKEDKWDEHTVAYDKSTSEWIFTYVLPSLMPKQVPAFNPVLHAVSNVVRHLLRRGDAAYPAGGIGAMLDAGIASSRLASAKYGTYQLIEGPKEFYRAVTGTIVVVEREMDVEPSGPPFLGNTTMGISLQYGDGTQIADVASSDIHAKPTLSHIAPTSGTAFGGTVLTVWGTDFREGARLFVGGVECTGVELLDDTVVRGTTGPHAAYPSFVADVVVVNADGQSATLAGAFTYQTP